MNAVPLHRSDWTLRAACVGLPPALFSPEEPVAGHDSAARQETLVAAKAVCFGCPVLAGLPRIRLGQRGRGRDLGGLTATERSALLSNPRDSGGHTCAAGSRPRSGNRPSRSG